ncbi:GGDEF domain-containing protein [Rhizobium cauense]|uniref:GGDEF domain-containing protein n=1 Tax=Rhizobium cauense TaxID=1166683 RepID=UPI001C6E8C70|nr:GGDEF domain-containing protein [Rhizobium cauense]MBW9117387.1 GGDEF domain-containing protein [Rhizobium cauense]
MNGASFFLGVNFIVAASFSAVFVVVATRSRSRKAALWIGGGFGVASLSAICELLVAYTSVPKPWALGAFATVLIGMVMLGVGIGKLHEKRISPWIPVTFVGASLVLSYFIYDLPRGTFIHTFLYQTPFAIVILTTAAAVLSLRKRSWIVRFLGALLFLTGMHFYAKAVLAVFAGSGATARDYVHTNYAIISQSLTAVLVVAVGLTLLATLTLEMMADQRNVSETDALSSLANRRGFDRMVQSILASWPDGPHAIIFCDLDHFKAINDTYGHHIGDLVIREFGQQLRGRSPTGAAAGRIGGEEFAVLLPNTGLDAAVQFAQTLRSATMRLANLPDTVNVTASFGVATFASAGELTEAYRKADMALYNAKNAGRNRVKIMQATS